MLTQEERNNIELIKKLCPKKSYFTANKKAGLEKGQDRNRKGR